MSGGSPEPLPFPDGSQPTVAPRSARMVYAQRSSDTDIFRVAGPAGSGSASRLISSTRKEVGPQYSADGSKIAFVSDRTGFEEIWVSDSDGRGVREVTTFGGPGVGSPRWSPDGKLIAFDSTLNGRAAIYVMGRDGQGLRRVTAAGATCVRPSWSHDGCWIYFGCAEGGHWQVWKTTPEGVRPIQVTQNGGREAFEDRRGEFLYYTKEPPIKGIWRLRLDGSGGTGGGEQKVSDSGVQGKWGLGGRGFYYLTDSSSLQFREFSLTRPGLPIALPGVSLGEDAKNMLAASPDHRWVLLSVPQLSAPRLMLARNFR